jgi:hypothetical protein
VAVQFEAGDQLVVGVHWIAWNRARSISVCGALPAHESKDIISIYADTTVDTGEGGEEREGKGE